MTERHLPTLTADELETLVRKAVRKELSAAGIRLDDPEQEDQAREDFRFLRKLRTTFDGASAKIGGALILAIFGGIVWLLTMGAQSFLSK